MLFVIGPFHPAAALSSRLLARFHLGNEMPLFCSRERTSARARFFFAFISARVLTRSSVRPLTRASVFSLFLVFVGLPHEGRFVPAVRPGPCFESER